MAIAHTSPTTAATTNPITVSSSVIAECFASSPALAWNSRATEPGEGTRYGFTQPIAPTSDHSSPSVTRKAAGRHQASTASESFEAQAGGFAPEPLKAFAATAAL